MSMANPKSSKSKAKEMPPKDDKSKDDAPKTGRMTEDDLRAKGRDFEPGTLRYVTAAFAAENPEVKNRIGKQVVQRKCRATGELFYVATSDLHQTFYHPNVRAEMKKRDKKRAQEKLEELEAENAKLREQLSKGESKAKSA